MTGSGLTLAVAVTAALFAAASFGLTGALQHRAAWLTPEADALRLRLIRDLVHQPLWLMSLGFNVLGIVLQWIALSTGPLILVQSLLVSGLLFAVFSTSALRRRRPDRLVVFGASLCVLGLAAFLLLAQPTGGGDRLTIEEVLPLAAGLAVLLAICLGIAVRGTEQVRTLALATATGVLYGVTAGLAKLAADDLRHGLLTALTDWPIYLVAVCGPVGFLLNQAAFRAGVALAPALSLIIVLDPLVGIGIGLLWLGETVRSDPAAIVGELLALAVLTTGVVVLSSHAPQAAVEAERKGRCAQKCT